MLFIVMQIVIRQIVVLQVPEVSFTVLMIYLLSSLAQRAQIFIGPSSEWPFLQSETNQALQYYSFLYILISLY